MAIFLEGLNIPEGNPITINIYRDGTWVNAYTTEDGKAIEVPDPHGRFIDAAALEDSFEPSDFWNYDAEDNCFAAVRIVHSASTVIPASKEGE